MNALMPVEDQTGLAPGAQVGKYRISRKIGEGGMATVYLATCTDDDGVAQPYALKMIRPELTHRAEVSKTLVQEGKIAAQLRHPNIVQVLDSGEQDGTPYLVMEWIDGAALGEVMVAAVRASRVPSVGTAVYVAHAVAEALAYLGTGVTLGSEGVSLIHRDISPGNVLISNEGVVKLTDFGIVTILDDPDTDAGVIKGKYAYMSPEQLRGDLVDQRADLFALGILLFETLTATRLFRRKTLAATVKAVDAALVPRPSSLNPAVPRELDAVVLRALARERQERFDSARELADALAPFAAEGQGSLAELTELVAMVDSGHAIGRRRPRLDEGGERGVGPSLPPALREEEEEIEVVVAPPRAEAELAAASPESDDDDDELPLQIDVEEAALDDEAVHPTTSSRIRHLGLGLLALGAALALGWWLFG